MPDAPYTYMFADLLSGAINIELPLYGVWFTRVINGAGNCTFSFSLDSEGFRNKDVLSATTPGKTTLYVDRGGSLAWGGIIWSRTYQAQAKSLQFNAQTFESYLGKQIVEENLSFDNADQRNILIRLIQHMQEKNRADIGIVVPPEYTSGGVARDVNITRGQAWSYLRAAEYLIDFDDGFDYTIDVRYGSGRVPQKVLRVDNELGEPLSSTHLAFDYPGNMKNYYFPENASKGATSTIGIGGGEENNKILSKDVQSDLYSLGYPDLQAVYTNTDVTRQSTLDSQTARAGKLNRVPITVPTFEVHPDIVPLLGSWSLGDHAIVEIEDARFPDGKRLSTRIIGWEVRPPGENQAETVKLVIPDEENAGA